MGLFQKSVEKKYLSELDAVLIDQKYKQFQDYFGNLQIQENIRNAKEEQFQEGFLRELFVSIFGYTLYPQPNFNLTTELKNILNSRKVDGAILKGEDAIAVIELKGTDTTDLDKIETQAFGYKNHNPKCVYVITSNFEKLRFYIQNAVDYIDFDLFKLSREQFALMWLCLAKDNLLSGLPLKIKESSVVKEENITKQLYADYAKLREAIYQNLVKNNPETDKLLLFKKTQKLLDRFLFIFFAEDRLLLPPNSINEIVKQWTTLKDELDEYIPLYDRFKKYFGYMNTGYKGKKYDIYAYNGGLFTPDEILDNITIDDDILHEHTLKLSSYDFETDVDVNILGHIFEHSLGDIESVQAEIKGEAIDNRKTKRKKDGIFYTPKYITKYIVENTIGKLCEEKRAELNIVDEEFAKERKNRRKDTIKALDDKLTEYRDWLLSLTILDPACGSGAFLNQALDFLIAEHQKIDDLKAQLFGAGLVFSDITTDILEKNIYGVDLNEESVEIAKLSLWLRTAQKGRKLNKLNNNLKCGNSLIDDPEVAGDKAFSWFKEFPNVFQKKDKKAWHVTFVTHDTRTSARMIKYNVRERQADGKMHIDRSVYLNEKDGLKVSEIIAEIVLEKKINCLAYNIGVDHVHMLLVCDENELSEILRKLKGKSAQKFKEYLGISNDETYNLWAQKSDKKPILSEEQFQNTLNYITNNRDKHFESDENKGVIVPDFEERILFIKGLQPLVERMTCTREYAFRTEYTGGFDVVIGNPPYIRVQGLKEHYFNHTVYYENNYKAAVGNYDIYALFMEKSHKLLSELGFVSFILPHKFLIADFGIGIRGYFINTNAVEEIVHFGSEMVFDDATTYTCIINLSKRDKEILKFKQISPFDLFKNTDFNSLPYSQLSSEQWTLADSHISKVLNKISTQPIQLKDVFKRFVQGIITGKDAVFCVSGEVKNNMLQIIDEHGKEHFIEKGILKPHLRGEDVNKYRSLENKEWLIFPYSLRDGKAELMSEETLQKKYPNTLNYLSNYEHVLRQRENGKFDNAFWYQYSRNQAISVMEQPKIITPEVCFGGSMTFDENNFYHNSKCHTLLLNSESSYTYKSILPILNSSLFWFYLSNSGNVLRGGYIGVKRKVLEPFSLPKSLNDSIKTEFEDKSELMLSLQLKFSSIKDKFSSLLTNNLEVEKLTRKLDSFYDYDFKVFLNELDKLKIKLSLSEQADWLDFFNQYKKEANQLQENIFSIDKEIDQMVYELYCLTDDEIKIVEESI